jgi:tetratricopeptide (TPR) repeat protein
MKARAVALFFLLVTFGQIFAGAPCCSSSISSHKAFRAHIECKRDDIDSNSPTPKIQTSLYPHFCISHLLADPDHCSSWTQNTNEAPDLDFVKEGHAEAYFDPKLISKLSPYLHFIPKNHRTCDYAHCNKCGDTVLRCLSSFETDDEDEDGYPIYINSVLYKCSCCGEEWLDLQTHDQTVSEICCNWIYCGEPSIYSKYMDWHHQTYFNHIESFLYYCKRNPTCSCYWPQVSKKACEISDAVYDALYPAAREFEYECKLKPINNYLACRSYHGLLSGLFSNAFFYSNYREILSSLTLFQRYCSEEIEELEEDIREKFLSLYGECLQKHPHPKIFYERGMVRFHLGETLDSLDDIKELISFAEKNNHSEFLTSDLYLKEGLGLSEIISYDEAIVSLTKAIEKDPKNKEAYFERAFAYFEKGKFDQALADYLASGFKPHKVDPKKIKAFNPLKFSQGLLSGMLKGSKESAVEFVPSLLGSLQGINRGVWALVSNPLKVSQDFLEASYICVQYMKENTSYENLSKLAPELQECLKKWYELDHKTKGQYIGHVIGKYGVDIFMGAGCMKAVHAYRELRRANALLTLESVAHSPKLQKKILNQAAKQATARETILKNRSLKIKWDSQGKHLIDHKNYEPNRFRSILTHKDPQKLVNDFAGKGLRSSGDIPGVPGYKEIINFKEPIGYHVNKETGEKIATTWGKIHYAKDGVHLVPTMPRK